MTTCAPATQSPGGSSGEPSCVSHLAFLHHMEGPFHFLWRILPRATGIVACFSLIKAQSLSVSSHMQRASSRTCYCAWDCDSDSQPPRHSRVLALSWATRLQPLATRAFSQGLIPYFPFVLGGRRPPPRLEVMQGERAGMAFVTGGPFAAASLG